MRVDKHACRPAHPYMASKQKVFVGLSGGVDSAVSAALLQREGYDVSAVFIKIWQPEFTECTWREDRLDAMRVAAHLKIPFYEIDLSDEYKDEVVRDMIYAYRSGVTPNPDVICNERIKFGHFLRFALGHGADCVATGHYAVNRKNDDGTFALCRGADPEKDQSYFLYRLGQHELSHAKFPVGGLQKARVRELAHDLGLPVAAKRDSQGLCFVGPVTIPEFLSRYIELKRGHVVNEAGTVIGEHDGAALFTIGQRHGFRLTTASPRPLYVRSIDISNNSVIVAEDPSVAAVREVDIEPIHWIGTSCEGQDIFAQARYRERAVRARVAGTRVLFEEPHVVSLGQSIVLYDGDVCVGGGIARRTRPGIHTSA